MKNEKYLQSCLMLYRETKNLLFLNMFTFTSKTNVPITLDSKVKEVEDLIY